MPGYSDQYIDPETLKTQALVAELNKYTPEGSHKPVNTGSLTKDFILNVLRTAPMGLRLPLAKTSPVNIPARIPASEPITGGAGQSYLVNPEARTTLSPDWIRPVTRHNQGSAKDLSLQEGVQPTIRAIETPRANNENVPPKYDAGPAILEETLPNPPPGLLRDARSQINPETDLPFAMRYNRNFGSKNYEPNANFNIPPNEIPGLVAALEKEILSKPGGRFTYRDQLILQQIKELQKPNSVPKPTAAGFLSEFRDVINDLITRKPPTR